MERTVNIDIDDLYDVASYALVDCKGCSKENHKECDKYKLFMELNIPVPKNRQTAAHTRTKKGDKHKWQAKRNQT